MIHRTVAFIVLLVFAVSGAAATETIAGANYAIPVNRYGHFALGKPHEYARVTVTTDVGRTLTFELPNDEVFEDLAPRVVRLAADESPEVLTIVSHRERGARLVLIRLRDGRLEIDAQSPAIGMANRWLNPIGVADLDGDASAEVAAVITPHIGGTLKVYRRVGRELVEVAMLAGFSNHVYGTSELRLSAIVSAGGKARLLVPNAMRRQLRVIGLVEGRLVEVGLCRLAAPIVGPVRSVSAAEVSVGLVSGPRAIAWDRCLSSKGQAEPK